MATPTGAHVNPASYMHEEHDHETYRKRVTSRIDGNSLVYSMEDFEEGDSPAVLDVYTDLGGRIATTGFVENMGPGDMLVSVSFNGSVYGGDYLLSGGAILSLKDETISRIKITWVEPTQWQVRIG